MEKILRIFSFGGGVQSTACLVLAARGQISVDHFVFANVGVQSENPDTLRYIQEFTIPYALSNGISFIEVSRGIELYDYVVRPNLRSVVIPANRRKEGGKDGKTRRNCTTDWKISVVDRWVKQKLSNPDSYAMVGLGISTDEITRVRSKVWHNEYGGKKLGYWKSRWYPLVDLRISRMDCIEIIKSERLPEPPKSSCYFCPFKRLPEWVALKVERPDLFEKAARLEAALNEKGLEGEYRFRKSPEWLTIRELVELVEFQEQHPYPSKLNINDTELSCDEGVCFT